MRIWGGLWCESVGSEWVGVGTLVATHLSLGIGDQLARDALQAGERVPKHLGPSNGAHSRCCCHSRLAGQRVELWENNGALG